jgi:NAD+ kinase
MSAKRRVYFVAAPKKPRALAALDDLLAFAADRCKVAGHGVDVEGAASIASKVDRVIVLGGDGTLIGVVRSLGDHQRPIIGVNVGKLGYLAEFSLEELKKCFDLATGDDQLIARRTLLTMSVTRNGSTCHSGILVNDCVVQAGSPFRMITLGVSIDGNPLTDVAGDGAIVCTPTGSTAHNLSAGGPIMQGEVDAIVLTPLCPHSLTHKPLVIDSSARIEIHARQVNRGTTLIIDGQLSFPLRHDDVITLQRFSEDFQLVRNPLFPPWRNLMTKLRWGQPPNYE